MRPAWTWASSRKQSEALGVTRNTLSELVNEKRGMSPEMAMRLSKVIGGSAESWLVQQAQYEMVKPEGSMHSCNTTTPG